MSSEQAPVRRIALAIALAACAATARAAAPRCIADPSSARDEVSAAFAELQAIQRQRIPGPAGRQLLDHRIGKLIERLADFDVFVDLALGDAWTAAGDAQKKSWSDVLGAALRRRYLHQLGAPVATRLEFRAVKLACDHAEVALTIYNRDDEPKDVVLSLVTAPSPAPSPSNVRWLAYDVAIDGVSLLDTWRDRFRRLYEDGGLVAVDKDIRTLRERGGPD